MSESQPRRDLRLSIPADAAFYEVARDVAARFAEYVGAAATAAAELGRSVERMATHMNGASIDFAMEPRDHVLTVRATSGTAAEETSCPLE